MQKRECLSKSTEVEKHRVDLGNNEWLKTVEDKPGKVNWVRQRVSKTRSLALAKTGSNSQLEVFE